MTNLSLAIHLLPTALLETMYMVLTSTAFAWLLGFPLGFVLFSCAKSSKNTWRRVYLILNLLVNVGRSFPFAILMIALIPLTKWIVGTSLGTTATIVPLSIAAAPFFARLVESAFKEVNQTLLSAMGLMGASSKQLFIHVLLPETLPSLIQATTLTAVSLVGYSAMAGLIGGGGLGQVALQYGYQRFNTYILGCAILLLLLFVEGLQYAGNKISEKLLKKRGQSHRA